MKKRRKIKCSFITVVLRKIKKIRKRNKIKLSFITAENIIYFVLALLCIVVLINTYRISCVVTQDIIKSIVTSILASVLIPFWLNVGKIIHEEKILKETCASLINRSIFLIKALNDYIAPSGKKPFSCYSDLKGRNNIISEINFNNFDTFDEFFRLMPRNLTRIVDLDYISISDILELLVEELNEAIPTATNEKNYPLLFRKLIQVVGLIGTIKFPLSRNNYIRQFDNEINRNYKENEYIYFKTTDDYITQCLENDLSEKEYYFQQNSSV